ncbi:hypothetical protein [Paenibacillus sp. HB172176]|uniref:aldose epimerase family protein n=1 Tax=Paenibacillus sp. HB172176 TaxID=2493690 RepID=UPI001439FD55|nr:hypothetical protein [Paenibacillus sp. HB172176]
MNHGRWEKTTFEGYSAWKGFNVNLELMLLPSLGSKIVSLKDRVTGREWLSRTAMPLGHRGYGSSFAEGDGSGWDEMFPTIDACELQESPWRGTKLPDHGEVWSLPWRCEPIQDNRLHCAVDGLQLPYRLEKTYSFTDKGRLRIDYRAANVSSDPIPFLWAAHPLFQVNAGMMIEVPDELNRVIVSYSHKNRLGARGSRLSWPRASLPGQTEVFLNDVEAACAQTAEKFYFDGMLPEGRVSLYDPASGEKLTLLFPQEKIPYLAIWANYGGYSNQYHVALEPATGFLDNVATAWRQGKTAIIAGFGQYEWSLELDLEHNKRGE